MGKPRPSAAYILGVGLTKFHKPTPSPDYPALGYEAGLKALLDADLNYDSVDAGIACYCFGESTCGQRVFYQFGMTSIPIYNVNNNCSTGSTGLVLARDMVSHGVVECVMVLGFEKMSMGALKVESKGRTSPIGTTLQMVEETRGLTDSPAGAQIFGNAGMEYMEKYGAETSDLAEIARINHLHSVKNPYSQFRTAYTMDEILSSPMIHPPLTKLQCCPTSDGAAAAIVVSKSFLRSRPKLWQNAVLIAGQCLATDPPSLFNRSAISLAGADMTAHAARTALAEAGLSPSDIRLCELHDCFSSNELITLEALGFCPQGTAHLVVRRGDITYGGTCVVNPSGGLISKGHPLGATGIAQCCELIWQLRGWANNRHVPSANALQHNLGLGGAVVVTVYKRADGAFSDALSDEEVGRKSGVGYNPATEVRGSFTDEEVERTRSQVAKSEWALGKKSGAKL